jgi:hypothetical protein
MDEDKKHSGMSGGAKSGASQASGGMSQAAGSKGMAADKPSGGTSVGSSTEFGSGGKGSAAGGASAAKSTAGDKPAGIDSGLGSGGTGATDAPTLGAIPGGDTATAGDKPPMGGPGSGMGGGPRTNGNGHGGHHHERHGVGSDAGMHGIEDPRGMAGQLFGDMRHAAEEMLEERKERAAETVQGVAQALRRTAANLESENDLIARYAEQAAETVERFSETVRQRRLGDMLADLDDFARRQPTLFLVGAVAAGFVVGRFVAASADRRRADYEDDVAGGMSRGSERNFRTRGNA